MKNILVVDDEFGNAEVLGLILTEEGYRVRCAANGRDGLEKVDEELPDLVILDYMMPIMNGAEMGRRLRSSPASQAVKIVMQSSLSEQMVRSEWSGFDAFLRKPYNVDVLLRIVDELLQESSS